MPFYLLSHPVDCARTVTCLTTYRSK